MSLNDLHALAQDLWWTTDPAADRLWSLLGDDLYRATGGNPVALLKATDIEALDADTKAELSAWVERWPRGARLADPPTPQRVAYFCMEFGIHESLPIYSGGLGMLAGDHLRSASDLGIDMVAVGLMYRQGYFVQQIENGKQTAHYPVNDPSMLPVRPVLGPDGEPVRIVIPDGHTEYTATAWEARIGHVRLFLLDTNLPENSAPVKELTDRLYGGDERTRLHQEVLLGFGGKRLLDRLGIEPDVFHMNEGHAAFLVLALVSEAVARGQSPEEAWAAARAQCVFTTHTPVPAGHDRFDPGAVSAVLHTTLESAGLAEHDWKPVAVTDDHAFCMSTLAIRGSRKVNGVSKLHAEVSNEMFAHLGVNIQPITNGVHPTAWLAEATMGLFNTHLPGWREQISDHEFWAQASAIPTDALLATRTALRERLIDAIRVAMNDPEALDPSALTIGFARRFATYKRANLLFAQPDRLAAILDRGVQVVFSGKAHPRDVYGQALIEEIIGWSRDPRFAGRIVFVPGYDPRWGRLLTQGADVWLNNPRRPREASGTSGQKAALNGNPNLSVLDGWWPEGADGTNGWSIQGRSDAEDVEELYQLLEGPVLAAFEDPEQWATMMRRNFETNVPLFNTDRMLRDYCRVMYNS
ncbi:MAG: alpha-glucan family phosphorylase [Myxococcota bacterium]|nr:alpha-glucan family phosphorylase [Myxococcota bacterium]